MTSPTNSDVLTCQICYEDLPNIEENSSARADHQVVEVTRTVCNHIFHESCLNSWLATKRRAREDGTCPYCRAVIKRYVDTTLERNTPFNSQTYVNGAELLTSVYFGSGEMTPRGILFLETQPSQPVIDPELAAFIEDATRRLQHMFPEMRL